MKTLLLTNRKGGVGKTTIACHAAWYFSESKRVLLIELDTQRNASHTLAAHKSNVTTSQLLMHDVDIPRLSGPGITVVEADDDLNALIADADKYLAKLIKNLRAAGDYYELCIIDASPSSNTLNIGVMAFATHVIAPINLTAYSLQGIESLLQQIIGMRTQFNKSMEFLGMLPNAYVANSTSQTDALKGLFETVGTKFMFDAIISQRQAYADAAAAAVPVWKMDKTAARAAGREMRSVMEKISDRLFA